MERSRGLNQLARELILWCINPQIYLTAVHFVGVDNVKADCLSYHIVENPCRIDHSTSGL